MNVMTVSSKPKPKAQKPKKTANVPSTYVRAAIKEQCKYNPITGIIKRTTHLGCRIVKDRAVFSHKNVKVSCSVGQIAWFLSYGSWPTQMVGHVDHNQKNNRLTNLRLTTHQLSARGRRKMKRKTSSRYKGVSKHVRKYRAIRWYAHVQLPDGRGKHVGSFKTEREAARAYDAAASEAYGKFAKLNFPNQLLVKLTVKKPNAVRKANMNSKPSTLPMKVPSALVLATIKSEFAYDPDTGVLTRTTRLGKRQITARTIVKGYRVVAHRAAWFLTYGEWPACIIDHIDRNKKNNRIGNLRLATAKQNGQNKSKVKTPTISAYKGVQRDRDKWAATITSDGVAKHLGTFNTEEEAAKAYDVAAIARHGEFAATNFGRKTSLGDTPIVIPKPTVEERFWAKVDKRNESECWRWLAAPNAKGYGRFYDGESNIPAHRYSYVLVNGFVPAGLILLHSCDHPWCVNPKHLRPGTIRENAIEARERGLLKPARGEDCGSSKLSALDIPVIRRRYDLGETPSAIAKDYTNVSVGAIREVGRRRSWTHIPEEEDTSIQERVLFPDWDEIQTLASGAGATSAGS